MTDQEHRRRGRAQLVVGVVLVTVMVATWLLWRDLTATGVIVSLRDELDDFPAPEELTAVTDIRTGTGAPFFGERRGRIRIYATNVDADRTCDLIAEALAAWPVDAQTTVTRGGTTSDDRPQEACGFAGTRDTRAIGAPTHVRARVFAAAEYAKLADLLEDERPALEPGSGAAVELQVAR